MPALATHIPRTSRSRWTPSGAMHQRPDSVKSSSHSRPCLKPRADHYPRHPRPHCRCTAATNHRNPPPCPNSCVDHNDQPHPPPRLHSLPPPMGRCPTSTHLLPSPPTLRSPAMWIRSQPVLVAVAHSPHTSAWSVACESIAWRLANQCLEQHSPLTAPASTALTAAVHTLTACAYQVTCAFRKTYDRQPPAVGCGYAAPPEVNKPHSHLIRDQW
ncbi:hypothetical protein SprV_0301108200 [Sparganum proliferum]